MLTYIRSTPLHSVESTTAPATPEVPWCELTPQEEKQFEQDTQLKPLPPYEGIPRWPGISSVPAVLRTLDIFGTSIFALSGALAAANSGCDLIGCIIVGCFTAVGGGTWRDIIVLNKQPFWVQEWEYLILSVFVSIVVFLGWGLLPLGQEIFGVPLKGINGEAGLLVDWGDAIGIGVACVIGAMNGIRADCPACISALCGMITSTFGGLTRDVVLNRPVRILYSHAEVYAIITLTGAAAYLSLQRIAPRHQAARMLFCVALVVFLRQQAWTHGWRMPAWNINKPQP